MATELKLFCGFDEGSPDKGFAVQLRDGEDVINEMWLDEKEAAFLVSRLGQYFMFLRDIEEEK